MTEISPVTFKSACVISDSMVYLSASLDNLDKFDAEYSRCILFDYDDGLEAGWYYHDVEFDVVSVCYNNNPNNKKLFGISNEGHLEEYNGETSKFSYIDGAGLNEDWSLGKGYLFTIKAINQEIFVCGYDGQIYQFSNKKWSLINQGFELSRDNIEITNIELKSEENDISIIDICGRNSNEFFCVGRIGESGLIAHYDGKQWNVLERKTPATLYSLLLLKNKNVFAAGIQGNLFLIKDDNSIKRLTDLNIHADFYSLTEFNDDVYIGSSKGIYKYCDEKLTKIIISNLVDEDLVFKVEASESYLWAFTNKFILRFDNVKWEVIDHPDNKTDDMFFKNQISGSICPQSGYWFTVAKENSRQYFEKGNLFPNIKSDWGDVYWQFDGED